MYLVIPFLKKNILMDTIAGGVGGLITALLGDVESTIFHCYRLENEHFLKLVMM